MPRWPWRNGEETETDKANTALKQHGESSSSPGSEAASEGEHSGLFPLADTSADAENAVDIVAVHGLQGHWDTTWTGRAGKNWLRDFLPQQLRDVGIAARILSLGYDSRTAFTKAILDIEVVADMLLDRLEGIWDSQQEQSRPLILISHSLGGIVVKKAIIRAHERSQHYGLLLQHASFTAHLLQNYQLGFGTNPGFADALKRNTPTLADISRQFVERAAWLSIQTFYETERWGNQMVVDRDSAVLNLSNEIAVGVPDANHQTVCKFEQVNSQRYTTVWHAVRKMCRDALVKRVSVMGAHETVQREDTGLPALGDRGRASLKYTKDPEADSQRAQQRKIGESHPCFAGHKNAQKIDRKESLTAPVKASICNWVFETPSYVSWARRPGTDTFLVHGSDRKIVSYAVMVQSYHLYCKQNDFQRPLLCYFKCDANRSPPTDGVQILKSILTQLHVNIDEIMQSIRIKDQDDPESSQNLTVQQNLWEKCEESLIRIMDRELLLIIERLEDCESESKVALLEAIITHLKAPGKHSSWGLHRWFFTCQSEDALSRNILSSGIVFDIDTYRPLMKPADDFGEYYSSYKRHDSSWKGILK